MQFGKRTVFLLLFASMPILSLLANMSRFVTYLAHAMTLSFFALAFVVGASTPRFWGPALRALALPTLYVTAFFITSYFGVDFDYSVRYGVLRMPFIVTGFFVWYTIGFCYDEHRVATVVSTAFTVLAVVAVVLARKGVVDVEFTRVLNGPEVPLALVPAYLNSAVGMIGLLLLAGLASVKKTIVLCAGVALFVVWMVKRRGRIEGWPRMRLSSYRVLAGIVVLVVVAIPIAQVAAPFINQTISRIALERGDVYRFVMTVEFLRLLAEHFPLGTGFYTFGKLTFYTIPYGTWNGTDFTPEGMSLHSTPMHVLLEGGMAVTVILLLIYWKVFKAIRLMLAHPPTRGAATLMLGWVVVCLVYGLFNQLHATHYFFGVLGFALGCYDRYRPQLAAASQARLTAT